MTADVAKATKSASSSTSSVLNSALRGGSYLFVQKILTFSLNSFVLRKLHLSITGAVTVQLELALATIFLLRDGFRLGFLRVQSLEKTSQHEFGGGKRHYLQQIINVAWLSTLWSWFVAFGITLVAPLWVQYAIGTSHVNLSGTGPHEEMALMSHYTTVIRMYCLAAVAESLAEPMYLLAHCSLLVSWQVTAQGVGFLVRGVVLYLAIFGLDLGLLAYGFAEIAYATSLCLVFLLFFAQRLRQANGEDHHAFAMTQLTQLLPRPLAKWRDSVDPELSSLLVPLSLQSVVKYLLTEGDKWVLSLFASLQNMGVYGIVFHLGSLVPRILFLPVEEATKTIFSKMMSSWHVESEDAKDDQAKPKPKPDQQQRAQTLNDALEIVMVLLKVMNIIGLCFTCFGTRFAHTLVLLFYGAEKASLGVPEALALYCCYVHLLAINGVCEAFVHAVGREQQIMRLNRFMVLFFVLYASVSILFVKQLHLGVAGIIGANCVNMLCRIAFSLNFMATFFTDSTNGASMVGFYWRSLPHGVVLTAFAVSFCIASVSKLVLIDRLASPAMRHAWKPHLIHVAVGIVCFAVVCGSLLWKERRFLMDQVRRHLGKKSYKQHQD